MPYTSILESRVPSEDEKYPHLWEIGLMNKLSQKLFW